MIKPIKLSSLNEVMNGYSEKTEYETALEGCIGSHSICNGWIDIKRISSTHNAIVCRECNMRIPIPKAVKTFAGLRDYFAKALRNLR